MEHSWAKVVRLLTPFRIAGLLPLCRTGETRVASDPELLERPAPAKSKAKASARKRRAPTFASVRAKVDRARQGNDRPDIGAMSYEERDRVIFGT